MDTSKSRTVSLVKGWWSGICSVKSWLVNRVISFVLIMDTFMSRSNHWVIEKIIHFDVATYVMCGVFLFVIRFYFHLNLRVEKKRIYHFLLNIDVLNRQVMFWIFFCIYTDLLYIFFIKTPREKGFYCLGFRHISTFCSFIYVILRVFYIFFHFIFMLVLFFRIDELFIPIREN